MQSCPNCGEQNSDTAKFCQECATRLRTQPSPPQEARKTVTVLFCDLVGSTALGERLDSESLREVMDRYFTEMRAVLERHGGIVEKYIGDAVMAVFGLPRAHEDDALRAVRAALEMRSRLSILNKELRETWGVSLVNRTGINTGEVVVGDAAMGQRLTTGDAVNVAARLEQAAPADHVLIGRPTFLLVRDAVEVEEVEALRVKGRSEGVTAFRLIDVKRVDGISGQSSAPFVGREQELECLMERFTRATEQRKCQLVTVLGEPGVGKSRLVAEAVASLNNNETTVLRGRCLSYGEGMAFWPLTEIVRQAAAISDEDSSEVAHRQLTALARDERITDRVAALVGLSSASYPIEEGFWAVRTFLKSIASQRSLVVVLDDIHWAEETLLALIEHVVFAQDAAILVVCSARPELFERHPDWSMDNPDALVLDLEPLSDEETSALINGLLGEADTELRSPINRLAEGNPLFVEQIISMWIDEGLVRRVDEGWKISSDLPIASMPPTIEALMAARLDNLPSKERNLIASGSIMGDVFYRDALGVLSPDVAEGLGDGLAMLERRAFIRPHQSDLMGQQAFAFRHDLIRDATYRSILKRRRALLHERCADWLEAVVGDRLHDVEELIGYHLEQAYYYRKQLGTIAETDHNLARRAASLLYEAGLAARWRADSPTASKLFARVVSLLHHDDPKRLQALLWLGSSLHSEKLHEADAPVREARTIARATGRIDIELQADIILAHNMRQTDPDAYVSTGRHLAEKAIPILERAEDYVGLTRAWDLLGECLFDGGQAAAALEAWKKAIDYQVRAGGPPPRASLVNGYVWGPTPAGAASMALKEIVQDAPNEYTRAFALGRLAVVTAMQGRFDEARTQLIKASLIFEELGAVHELAALPAESGYEIESLAGEYERAESHLRKGASQLEALGAAGDLIAITAALSLCLSALGRFPEAQHYATIADSGPRGDPLQQAMVFRAKARVLAGTGHFERAERLARKAVEKIRETDWLNDRAAALVDLGDILTGSRSLDVVAVFQEALDLYERKGNAVAAANVRELVRGLSDHPSRPTSA